MNYKPLFNLYDRVDIRLLGVIGNIQGIYINSVNEVRYEVRYPIEDKKMETRHFDESELEFCDDNAEKVQVEYVTDFSILDEVKIKALNCTGKIWGIWLHPSNKHFYSVRYLYNKVYNEDNFKKGELVRHRALLRKFFK